MSERKSSTFISVAPSEVTPLIKQDIVHHVIERTGLPRTKAESAVDTVFEGLKQALAAGERIELRGFGVFSVRARKTGIGRNPRTGTEVNITPGKAVRFKPGKELHTIATGEAAKS
jgi:DNA-binding protein HU-beta